MTGPPPVAVPTYPREAAVAGDPRTGRLVYLPPNAVGFVAHIERWGLGRLMRRSPYLREHTT